MRDDFVVCCSWREWSCIRERNLREDQKGIRASFISVLMNPILECTLIKEFPSLLSVSISKSCSKQTYSFSTCLSKQNLFPNGSIKRNTLWEMFNQRLEMFNLPLGSRFQIRN